MGIRADLCKARIGEFQYDSSPCPTFYTSARFAVAGPQKKNPLAEVGCATTPNQHVIYKGA